MAAYFFTNDDRDVFKMVPIVSNVNIGFLRNFMNQNATGATGSFIISEVVFQNKDTIQYFLTFDDLITYFYFGKGLGNIMISGSIIADCHGNWNLLNNFMSYLGNLRGQQLGNVYDGLNISNNTGNLSVGGVSFVGVLGSFSVKSNTEPNSLNVVDFTLNLDIVDSSFAKPNITGLCY